MLHFRSPGHVGLALLAACCCAAAAGSSSSPLLTVHKSVFTDDVLDSLEQDGKTLVTSTGDGIASGGAVSRTVWIPREQWESPQYGLELAVARLFQVAKSGLPEGQLPAGAAVRAKWLPPRWRTPWIGPDEASLGSKGAPPVGQSKFPLRRSVLHFSGCTTTTFVAGAALGKNGEIDQVPTAGSFLWSERGRFGHWPGDRHSWSVADYRMQAFDGCPKKEQRGPHVSLHVDWWDRPVGNRTFDRKWAAETSFQPAASGDWEAPPPAKLRHRKITSADKDTFPLSLPSTTTDNVDGLQEQCVHLWAPRLPRNMSMKDGGQGLTVEWEAGTGCRGLPILKTPTSRAKENKIHALLGKPGARVMLIFVEANRIAEMACTAEKLQAKWGQGSRGVEAFVIDAGRSHSILPLFGLRRADVPAAVACVGGRYGEADIAKGISGGDDPAFIEIAGRVEKDSERTMALQRNSLPAQNALAHSVWMDEEHWVKRKGDLDRLCREPAAARASFTHGGHPTMCLFLFDRQREDTPGHDTHDRVLDEALKHEASQQSDWTAAWEAIFVPTGAGSGGFGWPAGAREVALRLGLGHRSPPFIAAWEPEWEKDGRKADIYPPMPGYERKDWDTATVANWLAGLDKIAGSNPPGWWWSLFTSPGFWVAAGAVICVVWMIVSMVLRSMYDAKQKQS
eukprot:TRINITY_DN19326_c0_g1_i1.p1 TRINITY_DN19326_c0_g1~~TRINITY_DN19326_c0_g1_i1.p1  ORF type:complete len:679 (+),score=108.47 TRINITY_DN19326_c0_g1_i1:64-2100(+)